MLQNEQNPATHTSWLKLGFFILLFIGLTVAGTLTVYLQFADRTFTFDMRLLEPINLLMILGLMLVYFASDGLRLYFILRALDEKVSLGIIARLVFVNIFFSNVTPMATGGGVAQIWYLSRAGVAVGHATAATTLRTILAIFFIFTLTPIFLYSLDSLNGQQTLINHIREALVVLTTLYLGFVLVVLFRARWLIGPVSWLLGRLHRFGMISHERHGRLQFKARREMLRFARSFSGFRKGRPLWIVLSVFFTGLFLLCLFSLPALVMVALGYDVDFVNTLGLVMVTTFVMYFAPTPGASGISEGVFGTFFRGILSANHLVLVTVAWRFVTIYVGMVIGLLVLQRDIIREGKKLR